MVKIMHTGDWHLSGKNFDRCKEGLRQILDIAVKNDVQCIVNSGDTMDRPNIADRHASTGKIVKLLLDFVREAREKGIHLIFVKGNHDELGAQESALEVIKGIVGVYVVDNAPQVININGVSIGLLPFISKGNFYSKYCVGKDSTTSDVMFRKAVGSIFGVFKHKFEEAGDVPKMLFYHGNLQGSKVNRGYTVDGSGFSFTVAELLATGADVISGSHIHKRMDGYCGAPWQNNFGEEGNPQGVEIYDCSFDKDDDGSFIIGEDFVELNLPQFKTIEIHEIKPFDLKNDWQYKLRFYSEEAFNAINKAVLDLPNVEYEQLWNKHKHVKRTEVELTSQLSVEDLMSEYIKINALPARVSKDEVMQEVKG